MATPVWQPSTFYAPGSLVQPATAQPAVPTPIPNWSFESGNVEWNLEAGLSITSSGDHFGPGTWSLQGDVGFLGNKFAEMQDFIDCVPGETITAKIQVQQGASSAGFTSGSVYLRFYDSSNVLISEHEGNIVNDGAGGAWHQSSVTASAPALTAFVRIAIRMNRFGQASPFWVDSVEWDKLSQSQAGLIFKAVQTAIGLSGSVEPTWPLVNGVQVVDNEVTWEAILATRIVWEAHPILVSGATEPAFVAVEGSTIGDNTINWRAISRRVTDPNCPNSKIVIIGASKVFSADDDIVPYCATVNPLDWSTANDAGYLPCNLQQYGANPVAGMGLYRSNLWVGNAQGSQVWQIDEDPANMALLDAFPVGTDYHDAVSPAFNDLFFLPSLGVRTLGIAGGSTNLQSGDVGMPIDSLVQESLRNAKVNGDRIQGLYYPAAGQYWLWFSPPDTPAGPITLTGTLANGTIGDDYSSGPLTVGNGFAPYRWSIDTGALPAGVTLNQFTGIFEGTPSVNGTFPIVVRVTDRFNRTTTSPQSILIAFSSDLVTVSQTSSTTFRSGATSAYTVTQTFATAQPLDMCSDGNGEYFIQGETVSPFFTLYRRQLSGNFNLLVAPLSPAPTVRVDGVSFTADGTYLAIAMMSADRVWLYKRDASGDTYTRVQIVVFSASVSPFAVKFSPDSNYLAVGHGFDVELYTRVGDVLTKVDFESMGQVRGLAWSADSTLLAATAANGASFMMAVSGSTMTKLGQSSVNAPGTSQSVMSQDGQFLYVRGNASPFLRCYQWTGTAFVTIANPANMPTTANTFITMTNNGRNIYVGSDTAGIVYEVGVGGVLSQATTISPAQTGGRYLNSSDHPS